MDDIVTRQVLPATLETPRRARGCLFGRFVTKLPVTLLLVLAATIVQARTAFFYGSEPPLAELAAYDRVVLDPTRVTAREVRWLSARGVIVHAYVSLGEIGVHDPLIQSLPQDALAGSNPAWKTRVADLTHAAWRTYVLETRLAPLADWGFQGAFLDTLDSYQLLDDPLGQQAALAELIGRIQTRYPALELILNRGFEVLAELPAPVAAVAVESLYSGWDAAAEDYREVSEDDRRWILDRLAEAAPHAGEVIVIDYLPAEAPERRVETARRIAGHGFDPWVALPSLTDLGTSDLVPEPRRLLVLHAESDSELAERDAHVLFGVIFDWLGYVVEYHDVRHGRPRLVPGVHAGVVTWLEGGATDALDWFEDWLLAAMDDGFPLAILAELPSSSDRVLARLGLRTADLGAQPEAQAVESASALLGGLEAPLRLRRYRIPRAVSVGAQNEVALSIRLADGGRVTPVVLGPWGGLALHPYLVEDHGGGRRRWMLDPYAFMAAALRHQPKPVFDTTTENGSRLMTVHVDGDGFPSRAFLPGSPLAADVLLGEFIERYDVPHTVSVIEGEVAATGLYPDQAPVLEAAARRIFAHPNVEIASHSYSHPFYWRPEMLGDDASLAYGLHLPIEGYRMNLAREIDGSVGYIDRVLAPPGKRVNVFLWTGAADPDDEALDRLAARGLLNVNGGNTHLLHSDASRLGVWPQARLEKRNLQVYAPVMNENVYTRNWEGPHYGYRKAIETFELTDSPRRLKPIGIYYHFYSATRPAGIAALHDVYRWALSSEVLPVPLSGFARRVQDYHEAYLYRDLDGNWVAGNLEVLRTLRLPAGLGYPLGEDVAGYSEHNGERYLHLVSGSARIALAGTPPAGPTLHHAAARIDHWQRGDDGAVALTLSGSLPVRFAVRSTTGCAFTPGSGGSQSRPSVDGLVSFELEEKETGNARLVCRQAQ